MSKWIHIVGVCGVTTSGIAVLFKDLGWKVTGSDKGFFSPVSDYLQSHKIQILIGFKKERLTFDNRHPDLVVYQGTKGKNNEEILEAQKLNLTIKSYPEVLEEYLINKNNSIVVCGSYGKTSTTAMLVNIFKKTNYKINYMFGGLNPDYSPNINVEKKSDFSIVEGDEYITSYKNTISKFFHYHPKYVVLTGVAWDHTDIFKTEKDYFDNFVKFINTIPKNGLLVYNQQDKKSVEIAENAKCRIVGFSTKSSITEQKSDWEIIYNSKPLPCLIKYPKDKSNLEIIPFERNVIGKINDGNFLAATVLAYELGIKKETIQEGIRTFKGIKRRMEIRYKSKDLIIIDDFGSTPAKLIRSLKKIDEDFPGFSTLVIFEPSAGSRVVENIKMFEQKISNCKLLILPKFTKLPINRDVKHFTEEELSNKLKNFGTNTKVILDDQQLVDFLIEYINKQKPLIVLFMGSHSFRKIIVNLFLLSNKWKK